MTVQWAYQQLVSVLLGNYPQQEAAIIANWAIEDLTGLKKLDRIIDKNALLSNEQLEKFNDISNVLAANKPIQQVLRKAWFAGLTLYVNEHVLIPRPETEDLVAWIVGVMQKQPSPFTILDIGSGSGCIPIALQQQLPHSNITSIDISEAALQVAQTNAATYQASIQFLQLNFLDETQWAQLPKYAVIVSNPPYIKQSESESMHNNVLLHEPHLALFVPDDAALIFYEKIAIFGLSHLLPTGNIWVEINESLGKETTAVFAAKGYETELQQDLQGKDRMLRAWLE
jgi:release factor glutamine methyltransferase